MVVNSSQGGGSKDTWVLEEDAAPAPTPPAPRRWRRRACRPAPGGLVGQQQQQQQQAAPMLARIAHELYWIGRQLARAEHTARMLDGVFHADLQGRADDPAGVRCRGTRC